MSDLKAYIEFISAAGAAHTQLRQLAQDAGADADLEAASRDALTDARVYEVRERLFIDASPTVVGAGQVMFERLRGLRRTVAAGAALSSLPCSAGPRGMAGSDARCAARTWSAKLTRSRPSYSH